MNDKLMIETINAPGRKLQWIGDNPNRRKSIALMVPQFNENSNSDFYRRLQYYHKVSELYKDLLDVILIDDGSTDDSLDVMKAYQVISNAPFFLASVKPNAQKVGALYMVALDLHHEYIILSDFDTDLEGMPKMFEIIEGMKRDKSLMGCYFRMLPYEGSGGTFLFQQLEYSVLRCLYKFHEKDGSVPVMPGAGACYKRGVLISIYSEHSGLRNGEDREATLLGLKLGYRAFYAEDVLTLTRPPLSFRALVKQRIRWNLGYIETVFKEKKHYAAEILKFNTIGARTLLDIGMIVMYLLLPIILISTLLISWKVGLMVNAVAYLIGIILPAHLLLLVPKESKELKGKRLYLILYYPVYKLLLDCIAWTGAMIKFIKIRRKMTRLENQFQHHNQN